MRKPRHYGELKAPGIEPVERDTLPENTQNDPGQKHFSEWTPAEWQDALAADNAKTLEAMRSKKERPHDIHYEVQRQENMPLEEQLSRFKSRLASEDAAEARHAYEARRAYNESLKSAERPDDPKEKPRDALERDTGEMTEAKRAQARTVAKQFPKEAEHQAGREISRAPSRGGRE